MLHLAVNVYHWGNDAQTRLLVEGLAPLVRRLLADGTIARFWFTSFDARGPHLTLFFTAHRHGIPALRDRLRHELEALLAAAPSTESLDTGTLAERHRQCRGKELCAADSLLGIAANNSFALCDHPDDAYPFSYGRRLADADALWRRVGELALWAIEHRGDGDAMAAAVCWTAAVDAALGDAGLDAEAYWRYHATTLVVPLADRLAADEAAVLAAVPGVVGARNQASFDRLWDRVEQDGWFGPETAPLVALACSDRAGATPWTLLREINHTTLGQLGLSVRLHLPLVFYAWQRNLSLSPAA